MPYNPNRGRCTCCPYGCTYIIPVICVVIAFFLTNGSVWSCNYFDVTFEPGNDLVPVSTKSSLFVGPMTVQAFNITNDGKLDKEDDDGRATCVLWSDHDELDNDDLDTPLIFARVVLVLIFIPAVIFLIVFLFGSCCIFSISLLKVMSWIFIVMGLLLPLAAVSMASKWCKDANDCAVRGSFITLFVSMILWIGAGIAIRFMKEKEPRDLPSQPAASSAAVEMTSNTNNTTTNNVVEQTIVEADGTVVKITTKTSTFPDGSQTKTETREVIQSGKTPPVASAVNAEYDEEIPVAAAKAVPY